MLQQREELPFRLRLLLRQHRRAVVTIARVEIAIADAEEAVAAVREEDAPEEVAVIRDVRGANSSRR